MKARDLAEGMTLTLTDEDFGTVSSKIVHLDFHKSIVSGKLSFVDFRLEDGTTGTYYNLDLEVDAK